MRKVLVYLVRAYRIGLSPFLGNNCRFYPSCSCYTEQAIARHGAIVGSWLAMRRVLRCHPWHEGGCDPVPEKFRRHS